MIELLLPYPPTINHYYGNLKRGGKYIKKPGQIFRQSVWAVVLPMKVKTMITPLSVTLDIYPPDRRKRDIDNINKALFDALEHAQVFANDCQIVELISRKHECDGIGRVEVKIKDAA